MRERKYRYSEIFGNTFQGEGSLTGTNTVWVRWFGCNKTCYKFGQNPNHPINKEDMYYEKLDPISIQTLDDAPIQDVGCDSWTSWHPKFRHLAVKATAQEIGDKLIEWNTNEYNPNGLFVHPNSGQDIHLCFTGGESMMSQAGIVEVLQYLKRIGNYPLNVTIETNGSVQLQEDFVIPEDITLLWSVSPKLESVTGERWADSICPNIVAEYSKLGNGQLKFVCDNTTDSWNEITKAIGEFRDAGVNWNIWIMPEGASSKAQGRHHALIADEAIRRGYYFTSRVHATIYGAVPGK